LVRYQPGPPIKERNKMLDALIKKLEGEAAVAKANINVYLTNPAGIGEHSDIIEAIEVQVEKMVAAEEKIQSIRENFMNPLL